MGVLENLGEFLRKCILAALQYDSIGWKPHLKRSTLSLHAEQVPKQRFNAVPPYEDPDVVCGSSVSTKFLKTMV